MSVAKSFGNLVLFADDDLMSREILSQMFSINGFSCEGHVNAEGLLSSAKLDEAECVVSDVYMPGMSGIELQRQLAQAYPFLPVLLVTAYGEVSIAVQALKQGAFDFIEKPFSPDDLLDRVRNAVAYGQNCRRKSQMVKSLSDRFACLSKREIEITKQIAAGNSVKEAARCLDISPRTVEHHRSNIIEKLQVNGVNELLHLYTRWHLLCSDPDSALPHQVR